MSARGPATVLQAKPLLVSAAPVAPVPTAPPQLVDPVTELIAVSTRHFEAGQREAENGHLETARTQFNRALEVLLELRRIHRLVMPGVAALRECAEACRRGRAADECCKGEALGLVHGHS